ncbi:MAG TPA: DHHA1 domain-containing protein, partial [Vicinamibacterales bacterium]
RIEAITGLDSLKTYQRMRDDIGEAAASLNTRAGDLVARIAALQDENKRLKRETQTLKVEAATAAWQVPDAKIVQGAAPVDYDFPGGAKLVAREVHGLDKDGLRALVDQHRSQIKSGIVVLASPSDGKVAIVVGVTPDLTKKAPAGQIVKQLAPIVGGGGGGRPDFAEAGGKDATKIADMLAASREVVEKMLMA